MNKKHGRPALRTGGDTGIQLYSARTSSHRFVCFNCRVCFHHSRRGSSSSSKPPCVNCKTPMFWAGVHFRAPRKRDVKEWAKLEIMIRAGKWFHYDGGGGEIKRLRVADAKEYARRRLTRSDPYDRANLGVALLAARLPGKGKRVATKGRIGRAWSGPETYELPT